MWPQPMQCYNYIIVCSDGVGRTGPSPCSVITILLCVVMVWGGQAVSSAFMPCWKESTQKMSSISSSL